VKKKDGTNRFCVDFTKLNAVTVKDPFPLPRIDDIFDYLSDSEYFTTIDFKSGYFQIPLDKKDRPKTAFSTRDNQYQFTVLPQGVTNGPPTFQRIVNQILGPTRWHYSLAYLDDVVIYSRTFGDHLNHLDNVFTRLNDANFRLNVNKCKLARKAIVLKTIRKLAEPVCGVSKKVHAVLSLSLLSLASPPSYQANA
jgi:hypothetical protein